MQQPDESALYQAKSTTNPLMHTIKQYIGIETELIPTQTIQLLKYDAKPCWILVEWQKN